MKIIRMTATFGKLDRAQLAPGPGLTLIEAPNEGGKSTWCAFLRAMFYGFPPRDRDKAGYLAEKNRYQPWSGRPMEGTVDLVWKGRGITLRRGPRGNVPWGAFSAVWTATGEAVPFLNAENCGETLLGVSREVFERTAFVGQGEVFLSPSGELEKRVATLAASGEEEVSFSQVERRLKDWQNRRKHNRTGLIPRLEEELAGVENLQARMAGTLRRSEAARQEKEALSARKEKLEQQLRAHAAAQRARQARRRRDALAARDEAQAACDRARAAAENLPPAEALRQAQGELSWANTLSANLRMAEKEIPAARQAAETARETAESDPCFGGQDPVQAAARAQSDHDEARRLGKNAPLPLSLLGAPAGCVLGFLLFRVSNGQTVSLPILILAALIGWAIIALPMFLSNRRRKQTLSALLARYDAQTPEDILDRAAGYSRKVSAAQEAERRVQSVTEERDKLADQRLELTGRLLHFVHPFAPEVTELFGVSAALSRALQQGETYRLARARLDAAEQVLSALPPVPEEENGPEPVSPPSGDPAELSARLSAVTGELARASDEAARLEGELRSLGDPAELDARRAALTEALERRRGEYAAISAALESLTAADSLLRERFSPAVNRKAGEYLAALTGGKYDKASLTRQFQALAQPAGESIPRQDLALSGGTAQQLYLAARLAMCELLLSSDESCPIVLDDVLDAFDDRRARDAVACLAQTARTRQVLLFSCHSRDGALLPPDAFHLRLD